MSVRGDGAWPWGAWPMEGAPNISCWSLLNYHLWAWKQVQVTGGPASPVISGAGAGGLVVLPKVVQSLSGQVRACCKTRSKGT